MKLFEKNNILLVRFSSIGDVILTSPIAKALRNAFPNARIDVLTTNSAADLYRYNPNINNLWLFDKSDNNDKIKALRQQIIASVGGKYDLVVDLQNNLRSWSMLAGLFKHKRKLRKNRLFKLALVNLKMQIHPPRHIVDRYFDTISDICSSCGDSLDLYLENGNNQHSATYSDENKALKIGLACGSQHFTKKWSADYYAQLISLIAQKHSSAFYLFGDKNDSPAAKAIISSASGNINDFTGKLSLLATAEKIYEMDFFITNDSGLMHIAAAGKVPLIAIFGSTVPELGFSPYGVSHRIAQVEVGCRPCTHIGRSSCPKEHFRCMTDLKPALVFAEFEKLMLSNKRY